MMKILKADVERLVKEEYGRASEQHGDRFHSPHEAYAVMLEELEEAQEELGDLTELFARSQNVLLANYWAATRADNYKVCLDAAGSIQEAAELAAAEMIQLAAMAYKAQKGYENEPVD